MNKIMRLPVVLLVAACAWGQTASRFNNLEVCSLCHLQIKAPAGTQTAGDVVGPSAMWPGSMMAHSARDPYWRAKVRFETSELPDLAPVIEDTCLRCHAPMQQYERRITGRRMSLDELDAIGGQGVGCTVCHQITGERLGAEESFEGGFRINDDRLTYGPHARPFAHPMEMHSGYSPTEGRHVLDSALCGTCHTVITPTVDAGGAVVGTFVEQAPYLEWLASDYAGTDVTCQACHLPRLEDARGRPVAQYIAHSPMGHWFPPTSPRSPFGRHELAGGNLQVLGMLQEDFPGAAGHLRRKAGETRRQLDSSLTLNLTPTLEAGQLKVTVTVTNNTGHKLPTGFPSRRIWLHLTAVDNAGEAFFESGAWDPSSGEIAGLEGIEPHHGRIRRPSEVVIYEAEMADSSGAPTVSLLRAASFHKDNRLLPSGFDLAKPLPEGIEPETIAPAGIGDDAGFEAGQHTVVYEIPTRAAEGPYRIHIEALFQTVKPAHAATIRSGTSEDERAFARLYERHHAPAVLARTEATVSPD